MDIGIYPPPPKKKSAQVNFLWGKMTSERLFNSFIHPQKLLYPQNKFLATPLVYKFRVWAVYGLQMSLHCPPKVADFRHLSRRKLISETVQDSPSCY